MGDEEAEPPQYDVDEMVEDIRRTVEQRRAAGDYPEGLESQLEAEFAAVKASLASDARVSNVLAQKVADLRATVVDVSGTAAASSRLPGGTAIHSAIERVVGRHTNQLAHSLRLVGEASAAALDETSRVLELNRRSDDRLLGDVLAGVLDRLAALDELIAVVRAIERRLDLVDGGASPTAK